jgi:hypothetical protein
MPDQAGEIEFMMGEPFRFRRLGQEPREAMESVLEQFDPVESGFSSNAALRAMAFRLSPPPDHPQSTRVFRRTTVIPSFP